MIGKKYIRNIKTKTTLFPIRIFKNIFTFEKKFTNLEEFDKNMSRNQNFKNCPKCN